MNQQDIADTLSRIESKLDALLGALAEDASEAPAKALDGSQMPAERDQTQSLG